MAYTTIDKPSDYFETVIWTGNGSARDITVSHGTNWIWGKRRNDTNAYWLMDTVRGVDKRLISSGTDAEDDPSTAILTAFNSNGFSLGTNSECNLNGATYVGWSWKAGTSFTNDASSTSVGTIDSAGSVSTDAGFSIVSYTGTGANATVAHGLGAVPKMFLLKCRTQGDRWVMYHNSLGNTHYISLDRTDAAVDQADQFNDTAPTSSVFSIGSSGQVSGNGETFIAYCFAEKKGYSKFGSYTGNGDADGAFVYTGFKPAFFMLKRTNGTEDWVIYDNKRDPINKAERILRPNATNAESTSFFADILSNGFKLRMASEAKVNGSGDTYIYMAFAESPLVSSSGVPTTAR